MAMNVLTKQKQWSNLLFGFSLKKPESEKTNKYIHEKKSKTYKIAQIMENEYKLLNISL